MWCWAASGEMVMDFLGVNVTQCDQANRRFGMTDCCSTPVPDGCVQGGWPEFDKYGFTFAKTSYSALSWNQIVEEIGQQRPFAFTWAWDGGGGHMMVIYGYAELDGVRYVMVHDPWPPNQGATRTIPYDDYVAGPGYSHWDDYFAVRRAAVPFGPRAGGPAAMPDIVPGQQDAINATRSEAARSLTTLRALLSTSGPGKANETMTLGEPITVSQLRLDELKAATPPAPGSTDSPALDLLRRKPTQAIYPVLGPAGTAQAEITIAQHGKTWRQGGMGSPVTVERVRSATSAPGDKPSSASAAIIAVPALNQQFVVLRTDEGERYVPVVDDPQTGFFTSQRLTANELLEKLIAAAKAHNNLPR